MASVCHLGSPVCANRRDTVSLAEESLCISFSSSCDLLFASQISKLVFAYSLSLYTTRQCSAPSKHNIEKIQTNQPSHHFHFAYQDAKLQWDLNFRGREGRHLSPSSQENCTLGTLLHVGCCHQYCGKWGFKMGIDKRLLAQGMKIATFFQKEKKQTNYLRCFHTSAPCSCVSLFEILYAL